MTRCQKTAAIVGVACGATALVGWRISTRRADVTDPAMIAKMPVKDLRDTEVESLVRAAFAGARSIHIHSEAAPSITVTAPPDLKKLANDFAVVADAEQLPMYRHPGLEYTVITFNGPLSPQIRFAGPKDAVLTSGRPGQSRRFAVRTRFAQSVADLLRLKLAQ